MDINYNDYTNFIKTVVESNDLSFFKSHPAYVNILEHVNESQGREYLHAIQSKTSISDALLQSYCILNDARGNPKKVKYGNLETSPSSLRYAWHAHLILTYCKTLAKPAYHLVEIGGGYGGLCYALYYFSEMMYKVPIQSYTIIDLPEPLQLQALYLENVPLSYPVNYVDANTYGKEITTTDLFLENAPFPYPINYVDANTYGKYITTTDLFLISNYCFSEIRPDYQQQYRTHLFPKVSHGFMAWNMIPLYDFGFSTRVEEEVPKTGEHNKFVYF